MTKEEAARILDPETSRDALCEIEYYNGFSGEKAVKEAVTDACRIAAAVLRDSARVDREAWVDVKERMPEDDQGVVVIANGKPIEHLTLKDAYELAEWSKDDGWILECWPVWDGAVVTHWMPLPEAPEDGVVE